MQSLIDADPNSVKQITPTFAKTSECASASQKTEATTYQSIQVTRGIAALIVVWLHLGQAEANLAANLPHILTPFVFLGHAGVDAFFVVSGFVLTSSHWNDFGKSKVSSFLLKRLIRIYPYYVVTCVPYLVMQVLEQHHLSSKILPGLALVPRFSTSINPVAWSLAFEIMFYVTLACFLPFKRSALFPGVALWVMAVAVFNVCFPGLNFHDNACAEYIMHPISMEFMAGVLLAALVKHGIKPPSVFTMIVGAIWLIIGCLMRHPGAADDFVSNGWRCVWFGVPCFLLIYGLITLEIDNFNLRFPKLLLVLGDASYSIYLLHFFIIFLIKPWYVLLSTPLSCVVATLACVFLMPIVCLPAYYWVEKPLLNFCRLALRKVDAI